MFVNFQTCSYQSNSISSILCSWVPSVFFIWVFFKSLDHYLSFQLMTSLELDFTYCHQLSHIKTYSFSFKIWTIFSTPIQTLIVESSIQGEGDDTTCVLVNQDRERLFHNQENISPWKKAFFTIYWHIPNLYHRLTPPPPPPARRFPCLN
jgi:hypothetical protein